jgi:hypothetical protein
MAILISSSRSKASRPVTLYCVRRITLAIGFSILGLSLLLLTGCDSNPSGGEVGSGQTPDPSGASCAIPTSNFADGGVGKDGIPALTDPAFVNAEAADYLSGTDRVIGLEVDGQAYAVPHNILWWHEIANLNFETMQLAVTYCPLTGSSLAFDRAVIDGAEFGVSGLLFNNNLTMYDRTNRESLWPQMNRQAGCGPRTGRSLTMYPIMEMTWAGWRALHPDTRAIAEATGFDRNYTTSGYPYGDYEERNNDRLLFDIPIDERRPPKERVLGISAGGPDSEGGVAYPFGILNDGTPVKVINDVVGDDAVVVLWHADSEGAMAYHTTVDGEVLMFEDRNGEIMDSNTESVWTVTGMAISGPMQGTRLAPVDRAYTAFWFAWAAFQAETQIWGNS